MGTARASSSTQAADLSKSRPSPPAAAAYRLIRAQKIQEACKIFLDEIESGSQDYWVFEGVAYCGAESEEYESPALEALQQRQESSALALCSHGKLLFGLALFKQAEQTLASCVERIPGQAQYWSALGASVRAQGDFQRAIPIFETAARLVPDSEKAGQELAETRRMAATYDSDLFARYVSSPYMGTQATAAHRLLNRGRFRTACRAYLSYLREGSQDPWVFQSVALCMMHDPAYRKPFQKAFQRYPEDSPLTLLGRGYIYFSDSRFEQAEELIRRSVEVAPEMALGWDALGAAVWKQQGAQKAIPFFEKALSIAPALKITQANLRLAKVYAGIFVRLFRLLTEIPARWDIISQPLVASAGHSAQEVLNAALPIELQTAKSRISDLSMRLPAERLEEIERLIKNGIVTEVDLWVPALLAQESRGQNLEAAALILETWLQLAEAAGRRDVLHSAARDALDLALQLPRTFESLPDAFREWDRLQGLSEDGHLGRAQLLLAYARFLQKIEDHSEALRICLQAKALFESAHDTLGQANTHNLEADLLFRAGKHQLALDAYRKARSLSRSVGYTLGEANSWSGQSQVLFFLGDSQGAMDALGKARPLFEAAGDLLGEGRVFLQEGEILEVAERLPQALQAYRRSRDLFMEIGNRQGEGNSWLQEGLLLARLEDESGALQAYRQARTLFEAVGDLSGQANTWYGEAHLSFRRLEMAGAQHAYDRARTLFEEAGNASGQGNILILQGNLQIVSGNVQGAIEAYRRARSLYAGIDDRLGRANSWMGEARALRVLGNWEQAAAASKEAERIFAEADMPNALVSALLSRAHALYELGNLDEAAVLAERAVKLHGQTRSGRIIDSHRTLFDQRIGLGYELLVTIAFRQGRYEKALSWAEAARSRSLLDLLTIPSSAAEKASLPEIRLKRSRLTQQLQEVEEAISGASDPAERRLLNMRRRNLDRLLEWNLFEQEASLPSSLPSAAPLDASGVEKLAEQSGPILLYHVIDGQVLGFLASPGQNHLIAESIALSWGQLSQDVERFRKELSNPLYEAHSLELARKFWDLLLAPFAPYLAGQARLTLIPHGPLHGLPFEALLDPAGKRLCQRWAFSTAPSASALQQTRHHHRPRGPDEPFFALLSGRGLRRPESEGRLIASLFDPDQQESTAADFEAYLEGVPAARQLFIASRGVHVQGSRRETFVEIQPSANHDSRLNAAEIATIPLDAELVTLAACDASAGEALLSDERLDLVRAFLIAGSSAVLATRWKVPEDESTSRFLLDFYQAYRKGGPQDRGMRKDEALNLARHLSRERGDPAQVWAAWVLVGDSR